MLCSSESGVVSFTIPNLEKKAQNEGRSCKEADEEGKSA